MDNGYTSQRDEQIYAAQLLARNAAYLATYPTAVIISGHLKELNVPIEKISDYFSTWE